MENHHFEVKITKITIFSLWSSMIKASVCENTWKQHLSWFWLSPRRQPWSKPFGEKNLNCGYMTCDLHSPPSTSQPSSPSSVTITFSCYLLVSSFLLYFGPRCRLGITPGVIHKVKEIWICVLSCAVPQLWSHWVLGMVDQKSVDMVFRGRWSHDQTGNRFLGARDAMFFLDFPQHLGRQDFYWSNPAGRFFNLTSDVGTCNICGYTVNITWTVAWRKYNATLEMSSGCQTPIALVDDC